ncbi:hypothetical protein DASC09_046900 [Saccharomycopsis crataegensis]|uniref:NADH dehydrogenase [ubiquinone] 1 alpha subcomplex subunit n=1 Tax=Saccharomycopsis crataegensis TaxID=43959 RepID=A0AAV5QS19_9ASCO|nr:hypothetical protein DASC09_046900 [Saccharomycopsis crataegensis]
MEFLKGKVSLYKALWLKWRSLKSIPFRKKFFIGYDLKGNTYWEFYLESSQERMRRIVEYRNPAPHYEQSATSQDLPPQCMMWLRRTRPDFPTLEELQGDLIRQQRMKILAAQADERWRQGSLLQNPGLTKEQQERLNIITGGLHNNNSTKPEQEQATKEPNQVKEEKSESPFSTGQANDPIEEAVMKPHRR